MARIKFYNIDQAEWEYADMAVQVGGTPADITVSGTCASGESPSQLHWAGATYTPNKPVADLITKVQASGGNLTFDGGLLYTGESVFTGATCNKYYHPISSSVEVYDAETVSTLLETFSITTDGKTGGILARCLGTDAYERFGTAFTLIIYVDENGDGQAFATTEI